MHGWARCVEISMAVQEIPMAQGGVRLPGGRFITFSPPRILSFKREWSCLKEEKGICRKNGAAAPGGVPLFQRRAGPLRRPWGGRMMTVMDA